MIRSGKKRKYCSIALLVVFLGVVISPFLYKGIAAATYPSASALIVADIYSGPGTSYELIAAMSKGESATAMEQQGEWVKVKTSRNITGWVTGSSLKIDGAIPTPAPSPNTSVTATALVNIRSGAGTSYSVVAKMARGEKATVISVSGDWIQVRLPNGVTGWVSGQYLGASTSSATPAPAPTPTPTATPKPAVTTVVSTSILNVRASASTSSGILAVMAKGEKATVLAMNSGWYQIKLASGATGWASGTYLVASGSTPVPAQTPTPTPKPTATSGNSSSSSLIATATTSINVREGAGTNFKAISYMKKGDVADVLDSGNSWIKVRLADKTVGWVFSNYVTVKSGSTTAPTATPKPTATPVPSFNAATTEKTMLSLINGERTKKSAPALKVDATVAQIARQRAEKIRDMNYWSHNIPLDGYGTASAMLAAKKIHPNEIMECLVSGKTPAEALSKFLSSNECSSRLVDKRSTAVGIGTAVFSDGSIAFVVIIMNMASS